MPLTRCFLALAVALTCGCSRGEPEQEAPTAGSSNGPNSAINKLNETKATLSEIDAKRREQNKEGAEGQAP